MEVENQQPTKGVKPPLESEVQDAVDQTGFGKFHYKLFVICSMVFMNTGLGASSSGLIVPAASCDFKMRTEDKGRLTAAPMLGMVCGSYFWGCLADIKGRRTALLAALFLDGCAGLTSAFVPNYWVFAFLRFLNGFAITGQSAMIFPYLGEFQPKRLRETILCWLEMAWTAGIIMLPLLGWLIIPMTFRYTSENFSFASWNLFVLICSLPALSFSAVLLFFPESPKYLFEDSQDHRAMQILARMYAENSGKPAENYPVKFVRSGGDPLEAKLAVVSNDGLISPVKIKRRKKLLGKMLGDIVKHTMTILRPPYLTITLLTSTIQFAMTAAYYTLMSWFPELFRRFAEFEKENPDSSAGICSLSFVMPVANSTTQVDVVDEFGCETKLQGSVFLYTIFLGLACIPTSVWLPLCIGRLGYRFFLVVSTVFPGAAAVGLFFVTSSTQNLIVSCIFEALTSMGVSVVYCVLVTFYPTHLRVIAASFSALCGRSGALIGNLMFGYLLDLHCIVPIAVVAGLLFFGAALTFFLPRKAKLEKTDSTPVMN
ncbi:synaptic vesicle glycoprotein 2C isoform X1 [Neodiprion lecontei]|uniref:Synaptic vesicle glycoprotein 2C isoform X1 n=2 Tax=Neodiprion lecontei TaxID=441921 RepID=A0ABM3FWD3_NEOLC|nr:synaptic vesicle glycoprotein 2C isoform X1 [Neodiprion lecontei]